MTSDILFTDYLYIAKQVTRRFHRVLPKQITYDELYAAALVGLWKATTNWDSSKAGFPSHATMCAKNAMVDWLRRAHRSCQKYNERVLSFTDQDQLPCRRSLVPFQEIDNKDELDVVLQSMDKRDAAFLRSYVLEGKTIRQAARQVGYSHDRAYRRLRGCLRRLGRQTCTV